MKFRKTFSAFLSAAFVALVTFAATSTADAQGRYVNQYSRGDVDNIIRRMEENSDEFRSDFRRELNDSGLNSSTRNRFNGYVASMENAIDDLRRHFDRGDSWWESRSRVQNVVSQSQNTNSMMRTLPFRRQIERQWNQLRNQINRVADTYDLAGLDGGGWQGGGGGNGGGGGQGRPPSWARGTFYSSYPRITLTIEGNGRVTVINQGQTYYGSYNNGRIFLNNDTSTVSRWGNGIRTYNTNTGQTTDYSRSFGGDNGGGNDGDGPASNPPNWMVGTFYSGPGSNIVMSINGNGRITLVNNGLTYYGRYYAGQIYLNNDVSSVNRSGIGFTTYNRSSGITTEYSRRRR